MKKYHVERKKRSYTFTEAQLIPGGALTAIFNLMEQEDLRKYVYDDVTYRIEQVPFTYHVRTQLSVKAESRDQAETLVQNMVADTENIALMKVYK